MKKLTILFALLIGLVPVLFVQKNTTQDERMQWWRDARFGMFIHWVAYAQAACHERVKKRERISDEEYQKYFEIFNPDLSDPVEWAKKAKVAGMKHAVITTEHHEGFNMFKSEYTDYNIMNTHYEKI